MRPRLDRHGVAMRHLAMTSVGVGGEERSDGARGCRDDGVEVGGEERSDDAKGCRDDGVEVGGEERSDDAKGHPNDGVGVGGVIANEVKQSRLNLKPKNSVTSVGKKDFCFEKALDGGGGVNGKIVVVVRRGLLAGLCTCAVTDSKILRNNRYEKTPTIIRE